MFEKLVSFTKKVSDLPDRPTSNPKAIFDAAPEEVRVYLNKLIDALKSTVKDDSGAKNIGVTAITDVQGNDIQTILEKAVFIVEKGSNANGDYVKYADGRLECHRRVAVPSNNVIWSSGSFPGGAEYWYHQTTWTFPYPFKLGTFPTFSASGDIPTVGIEQHNLYGGDNNSCSAEHGIILATGSSRPNGLSATFYRSYHAYGVWK